MTKSVDDVVAEEEEYETSEKLTGQLAQARRDRDLAKRVNANLVTENAELRATLDLFGRLEEADPSPAKWLSPKRTSGNHGTLMLLLSDLHFDEVVKVEEMDGLNAFNRVIATMRVEKWVKNVIKLARQYLSGITYDGFVLMLGGDTFTGNIHDELKETNEDTLFGSLLYYQELLSSALDLLLDEFGKGFVVGVPGNHGRLTRKPRMKQRSKDNLDWLLCKLLEKEFSKDKRVDFNIPEAADIYFKVYDQGQLLTHGDQVSGGSGIGGIWPPIMRMRARKAQHHMNINQPFDTLWMGHWHTYIASPFLIINGAMKGYDEYAKLNNFGFEPPQQAMAIITPQHGLTWQAPVFCQDRKREGW